MPEFHLKPGPQHTKLMNAWKAHLAVEGADLDAMDILCLASQFVGNLIAVQDAKVWTTAQVMHIVEQSILMGNAIACDASPIMNPEGSA